MIYKIYNNSYVAAVISGTEELMRWLKSVRSPQILDSLVISPMIWAKYPFKIIEAESKFNRRFFVNVQPEDLDHTKSLMQSCGQEILAVYDIDEDFLGDPRSPGKDYMGILNHVHEGEGIEIDFGEE